MTERVLLLLAVLLLAGCSAADDVLRDEPPCVPVKHGDCGVLHDHPTTTPATPEGEDDEDDERLDAPGMLRDR